MNTSHNINVKDNVKPAVTPACKVAHALTPKLEKERKLMVDLDIIEPIEKPIDWVNGLVTVEKPNGKLRICLDIGSLNNARKREPHQGNIFTNGENTGLVLAFSQNQMLHWNIDK